MRTLNLVLLISCCFASAFSDVRDGQGVLRTFYGLSLSTDGNPVYMKSMDYPNGAPHDVEQTWRFVTYGESTTLSVDCNVLDIPKSSDSCGGYSFKINDNSPKEYCGKVGPLSLTTESNDVTFTFKSGPNGGGRMNCLVQAVNDNSLDEYDSSEHGTSPGVKDTTCPCGWSKKASVSRILNGNEATRYEFPYMAAVIETRTLNQFCGGAIISPWHVLTTASCTANKVKDCVPLSVIVGQHNIYDLDKTPGWQMIDVETTVVHPQYSSSDNVNDIALLTLKSQIKFLSDLVGPVCLPNGPMDYGTSILKIIGWGATQAGGSLSETLQKLNVKALASSNCFSKFPSLKRDPASHLCTFGQNRGPCDGDQGGPVIWLDPETNRFTLAGLVSSGLDCNGENPSVHTKVDAYLDWIRTQVSATKSSQVCTKRN